MLAIDLSGQTFGKLTVVGRAPNIGRRTAWLCQCECGAEKHVRTEHLRRGVVVSCFAPGCHKTSFKHGLTKGGARPAEYYVWSGMKDRCLNPNSLAYADYGGRGITVCERWRDFRNFLADMGARPFPDATIERRDVNGNYHPENCVWLAPREQPKNKRSTIWVEYQGTRMCLKDAARLAGIPYGTAHSRLKRGCDFASGAGA